MRSILIGLAVIVALLVGAFYVFINEFGVLLLVFGGILAIFMKAPINSIEKSYHSK